VTTIVGVVKNGHVIIGADSQVTSNSRPNMHPKLQKITKNNGYLIAGSGDSTPCDILQHIFVPPVPTATDRKDLYKFMITKFVPAMREVLDENGYKLDGNDKLEELLKEVISSTESLEKLGKEVGAQSALTDKQD